MLGGEILGIVDTALSLAHRDVLAPRHFTITINGDHDHATRF